MTTERERAAAQRANSALQRQQDDGSREHLDAMARGARWCYYVPSDSNYDGNGFVPSLVVEGVAGHVPMMGRGEAAQPWYFGDTYEQAKRTCERVNRDRGISPLEADAIVASSMRHSHVKRGAAR